MIDEDSHRVCVNAWMERMAKGLPPELLFQAFEHTFAALWGRAHQTLGDVTLTAIVGRVLYNAAEQYPILSALKIDATGLRCQELRDNSRSLQSDQLAEGIRFVLVEFLTILGELTADILTPALHAELLNIARADRKAPQEGAQAEPSAEGRRGVTP